MPPAPPTDPYVKYSLIRFVSTRRRASDPSRSQPGRMTRCCPHSKLMDDPRFRQRADPGGVPSRWPWRGQDCCLPVAATVGFGSGCPDLSSDHHYTFFGIQFRGLRPRLTSASHTVSRRSHFGSAIDRVASLWSVWIGRLSPTHPLGNSDEFQGVSPLFHRPELVSARAAPLFGDLFAVRLI